MGNNGITSNGEPPFNPIDLRHSTGLSNCITSLSSARSASDPMDVPGGGNLVWAQKG